SRVLFDGTPSWKAWFWSYLAAGVLSLVLVGLVWMAILNWKRKSLRYKITERTIDYETGLLSRRIETLQLWRVQDIDFRQSLLQRMLGVAEIRVFTKDTTDPELVLRGLPEARQVFEELKNAAELARQQRVVGLVQ
ncbi:MAG: PH domain-containing protein, partial [Polyangiaceae bacterium]|nr:PH domain-containing protein [Polyangiaceae bacterium]